MGRHFLFLALRSSCNASGLMHGLAWDVASGCDYKVSTDAIGIRMDPHTSARERDHGSCRRGRRLSRPVVCAIGLAHKQ